MKKVCLVVVSAASFLH